MQTTFCRGWVTQRAQVQRLRGVCWCHLTLNPPMLTATKSNLTIMMKTYRQKQSWKNIWKGNVIQNITNNSPSIIL